MITGINTGVCIDRFQRGEPDFFVNWQENGENHYYFTYCRFTIESKIKRLKNKYHENTSGL